MKLKFVTRFLFLSAFLVVCLFGKEVYAVEMGLVSEDGDHFAVGQEFEVNLMIDTQGKEINTVSADIVFPEDTVEVKDIRDGGSVLTLWVENPVLEGGMISFAGVVPGGFDGVRGSFEGVRPGEILSFTAKSVKEGDGSILLENVEVLLHDGEGTSTEYDVVGYEFSVEGKVEEEGEKEDVPTDLKPEPFKVRRMNNPNVFDGDHFVIFNTQDKGSGIDHYAVYESRTPKDPESISDKKWEVTKSPYLLKDQKLKSYIYVKAVNREGAYRIAELSPKYEAKWYDKNVTKVLLSVIMVFLLAGLFFSIKRKRVFER